MADNAATGLNADDVDEDKKEEEFFLRRKIRKNRSRSFTLTD